jgi:hypothetical protein
VSAEYHALFLLAVLLPGEQDPDLLSSLDEPFTSRVMARAGHWPACQPPLEHFQLFLQVAGLAVQLRCLHVPIRLWLAGIVLVNGFYGGDNFGQEFQRRGRVAVGFPCVQLQVPVAEVLAADLAAAVALVHVDTSNERLDVPYIRHALTIRRVSDIDPESAKVAYESFRVTRMSEPSAPVPAPDALKTWVEQHPRIEAIDDHGFDLNLGWWNDRISGMRGSPVTGVEGNTEQGHINRGYLFSLAAAAREDESGASALRLLWHSLAWGTGDKHRNSPRRIASVETNPSGTALLLRTAARRSAADPRSAFQLLKPRDNAIGSLGPNFFSKFLYFAGGGAVDHACLIVDARVLRSLHRETRRPVFAPKSTNYGPGVYEAALGVMGVWAEELSGPERTVGADEVERWAFETGERTVPPARE